MKPSLFLFSLIITLIFVSCKKRYTVPNNSIACMNTLDTFIVNNYKQDALDLYLGEIYGDTTNKNYNNPFY